MHVYVAKFRSEGKLRKQKKATDRSLNGIIFLMIAIRIKRVEKKGKEKEREKKRKEAGKSGSNCIEKW